MKHAFLHKNFRDLDFEKKIIFFAHLLTLIFCFFPWFQADPIGDVPFFYNAFEGPSFLIGLFIFLIAFVVVMLFIDRLLEKETVKLPFPETHFYFAVGIQELILIIMAWSVLGSIGADYNDHAIRFGIFFVFMAQIAGLVATFLYAQIQTQRKAQDFFKNPEAKPDKKVKQPTLIAKK